MNKVKESMHIEVYKHLCKINERFALILFNTITPEIKALIRHDAYAELIQMAQDGYLKTYYERLEKEAV